MAKEYKINVTVPYDSMTERDILQHVKTGLDVIGSMPLKEDSSKGIVVHGINIKVRRQSNGNAN